MKSLNLLDLLGLAGFAPRLGDRIVRHQSARYPVTELLRQDLLEAYQAYQSKPVFHRSEQIVSLYGLDGTRACFFGVFLKQGWRRSKDALLRTESLWEVEWRGETQFFYQLQRLPGFEHLQSEARMSGAWS